MQTTAAVRFVYNLFLSVFIHVVERREGGFALAIAGLGFLRRPLAIVAAGLTALTITFRNRQFVQIQGLNNAWCKTHLLKHFQLHGLSSKSKFVKARIAVAVIFFV
ncbi:uncharacterized protein LOC132312057 isoform X2 [Cornus florida]|uniref:uncharacterized protein LOC132312057 isoform X2 n=1 Tax=Cornus florida TaxID=4283 RepID=UPI00289A0CDB|nr:uncharacterized protein LOC132312057 isoform X2 [Cornus florida]